jgi:hypothetical protein
MEEARRARKKEDLAASSVVNDSSAATPGRLAIWSKLFYTVSDLG